MRGSVTFQDLFTDLTVTLPKKLSKGRCRVLDAKRNELLLSRYYYYGSYTQLRYNVIIYNLHKEFFLSERTVLDIIANNTELLHKFKKAPPTVAELRKKYPHLVW